MVRQKSYWDWPVWRLTVVVDPVSMKSALPMGWAVNFKVTVSPVTAPLTVRTPQA